MKLNKNNPILIINLLIESLIKDIRIKLHIIIKVLIQEKSILKIETHYL